ncbi:hypothetical protein Clacol_000521 [Clathrus columnatus]|uniref:Transcription elongation regulator 1 n=1 Tax=Clathrus columnatus TaxID=1419009 RepID=A0AAV4ZXA6_9AGAM|nr:hypothetical protein Clacol_000521 [Clathrus columnatus]
MSNTIPPMPLFSGFLPPLPPGWTEHTAPGGQPYYYHVATNQSTYVRPLPVPGVIPNAIIPGALPKNKKEKPVAKTPIPGTSWLRVKTTEGNLFYTHKERKESVWEVPDEIKEKVAQLEQEEKEREQQEVEEKLRQEEETRRQVEESQRLKEQEEIERIKQEVQSAVSHGKRKAPEHGEESKPAKRKKSPVETPEGDGSGHRFRDDGEQSIHETEWDNSESDTVSESKNIKPTFTVPNKVDLSIDEAKALFKTLLKEKDINPLHPWDKSLPLFISDPRYVLLPSVTARREAFDEYCRDTIRAQRAVKAASIKEETSNTGETDKDVYHRLLREEVSSTRTLWSDFRRKWKKDRRFYGWAGEKEREKAFKSWIKNLADMKKKQAEKAERDFFQLLKEHQNIKPGDDWKNAMTVLQVKQTVNAKDPRYDAVGSSSLREELFNVYVKTLNQTDIPSSNKEDQSQSTGRKDEKDRATRAQRALQEREQKVRRDRQNIERGLDRTRDVLGKEEGELDFGYDMYLLIVPLGTSWEEASPLFAGDFRFVHCVLSPSVQKDLFYKHVGRLRDRYIKSLHTLFAAHAPGLNTSWADVSSNARKTINRSLPASKLKLVVPDDDGDEDLDSDDEEAMRKRRNRKDAQVEIEFDRWQRQRNIDARKAFDSMLNENAFLEFWGRMGKAGGEGIEGGVKAEEEGEEDGEGGGGKADMKQLAKQIDGDEFGRVLKNDARWVAFDHMPEERMKWLRNHVEQLSAPKLSVHVPDKRTN